MQNTGTDSNRLPDELKGTRAGLFYLLGTTGQDLGTTQKPALSTSQQSTSTAKPDDDQRLGQWNSAVSMDNFQFVD